MDEEILKGKVFLVVDDEVDLRDIIASELEFLGGTAYQAENIQIAQKILADRHIDLILSDIRMPGGTGVDLLTHVKKQGSKAPPVILITGFADISIEDAFDKGAEALVSKPFKLDDLMKMVARSTSSLTDRYKGPVNQGQVVELEDMSDIKIGRGGLAIAARSPTRRIELGELVSFSVSYRNHQLEGSGICRWVRPGEPGQNKIFLGLEFMQLTDASLDALRVLSHEGAIVPFIPALRSN